MNTLFQVTVHFVMESLHFQADFPILVCSKISLDYSLFFWMLQPPVWQGFQSIFRVVAALKLLQLWEAVLITQSLPPGVHYTDQQQRGDKVLPANY